MKAETTRQLRQQIRELKEERRNTEPFQVEIKQVKASIQTLDQKMSGVGERIEKKIEKMCEAVAKNSQHRIETEVKITEIEEKAKELGSKYEQFVTDRPLPQSVLERNISQNISKTLKLWVLTIGSAIILSLLGILLSNFYYSTIRRNEYEGTKDRQEQQPKYNDQASKDRKRILEQEQEIKRLHKTQ